MDNANWASVHSYVVQDSCGIPLLLNVQQVFSRSKVEFDIVDYEFFDNTTQFERRGACYKVGLFWC
jgi:hypothetical protein